jgi:hypothetical protein
MSDEPDDKFIKIIYHQDLESVLELDDTARRELSQVFKEVIIAKFPQALEMLDIQECPTQPPPPPTAKIRVFMSSRFSEDGEESECESSESSQAS